MQLLKMKDERTPMWCAAFLFLIIGIVQLCRFFGHWSVMIGDHAVPLYVSAIAAIIGLGMSFWLAKAAKHSHG